MAYLSTIHLYCNELSWATRSSLFLYLSLSLSLAVPLPLFLYRILAFPFLHVWSPSAPPLYMPLSPFLPLSFSLFSISLPFTPCSLALSLTRLPPLILILSPTLQVAVENIDSNQSKIHARVDYIISLLVTWKETVDSIYWRKIFCDTSFHLSSPHTSREWWEVSVLDVARAAVGDAGCRAIAGGRTMTIDSYMRTCTKGQNKPTQRKRTQDCGSNSEVLICRSNSDFSAQLSERLGGRRVAWKFIIVWCVCCVCVTSHTAL